MVENNPYQAPASLLSEEDAVTDAAQPQGASKLRRVGRVGLLARLTLALGVMMAAQTFLIYASKPGNAFDVNVDDVLLFVLYLTPLLGGLAIALFAVIGRLHDLNRGAAYVVLLFVPYLNLLVLLILLVLSGTEGVNRYGKAGVIHLWEMFFAALGGTFLLLIAAVIGYALYH